MSSQAQPSPITATHRRATPPPAHRSGSEIDLLTLTITAIASAVAAFICSHVWAAGTLPSAAFMPVLVALVKEALRRPTEAVVTPGARVRTERRPVQHHWRVAAATGLAGFALFAFLATTTELLSGSTVSGRDGATTLFGGTRTVVVNESTTTVKTAAPQVTTVIQQVPGKTTTVTTPAPAQAVPTTPTQSQPVTPVTPTTQTPAPAAP